MKAVCYGNKAVFGIDSSGLGVENAVDALKAETFRNTDISVLFPQNEGSKDFAHEKGTKAPEGAAAGAGTGAIVGGALGWLAALALWPFLGSAPLLRAGPIMTALAGVGVGGNCWWVDRSSRWPGHS